MQFVPSYSAPASDDVTNMQIKAADISWRRSRSAPRSAGMLVTWPVTAARRRRRRCTSFLLDVIDDFPDERHAVIIARAVCRQFIRHRALAWQWYGDSDASRERSDQVVDGRGGQLANRPMVGWRRRSREMARRRFSLLTSAENTTWIGRTSTEWQLEAQQVHLQSDMNSEQFTRTCTVAASRRTVNNSAREHATQFPYTKLSVLQFFAKPATGNILCSTQKWA